jgi:hypothetical protein
MTIDVNWRDRFTAAYTIAAVLAEAGIPQERAELLITQVAHYGGPTELAELADKVVEAYEARRLAPTKGELTTTQHSALADLHRFGNLFVPTADNPMRRGGIFGFSRRTLQALVDGGYAVWSHGNGSIVPKR